MNSTEISTSVEHLDIIINDVQKMIDNNIDFNAFIIITLGIEYLGNFSDEKDFTEFKQSEIRFKNGLNYFKGNWYQNNKELLFKGLRGPLIHQYRPGEKIRLSSCCNQNATIKDNLEKDESGNTILILEQFFEDYKVAVETFKKKIETNHSLNKEKLEVQYSMVSSILSPSTNETYNTTGFTNTILSSTNKFGLIVTRRERRQLEREEKKKK